MLYICIVYRLSLLDAIYMYCIEIELLPISVAWKLGWHPSTLACLSSSSSNLPKEVPIVPHGQS
jgi:hypothetical protein